MYKQIVRKIIRALEATIEETSVVTTPKNAGKGMTVQDLVADMDRIPVKEGSIVFIHSGFKSIGLVDGGPDTVVDAILESFVAKRAVTVAMPSFTISGTMKNSLLSKEKFDVRSTQTVFRGIPLAFQQRPGLQRSIHPTHSVMAIGPKAKWLVESHHLCGTTFGVGSPFGKLLEQQSYLLGLGTGLGTVTFYHALEDIESDFPFRVYTEDSPFEAVCIDHEGKKLKVTVSAHDGSISPVRIDRKNGAWLREIYTKLLEKKAGLLWYKIGRANTWVCGVRECYDLQKKLTYSGLSIYSTEDDFANYISDRIEVISQPDQGIESGYFQAKQTLQVAD